MLQHFPQHLIHDTGKNDVSTPAPHIYYRIITFLFFVTIILAITNSTGFCAVIWDFNTLQPDGWDVITTSYGTRMESPFFSVTGDSIIIRFSGDVPDNIRGSILALDGSLQNEPFSISIREMSCDVSLLKNRTLFLAIDSKADPLTFLKEVFVDGEIDNDANRQHDTYRSIQDKLDQFDPLAVEDAYNAIARLLTNDAGTLPPYDPRAIERQYNELRELVRSSETEYIYSVTSYLDSLLTLKKNILLSHPRLKDTPVMFASGVSKSDDQNTPFSNIPGRTLKLLTLNGNNKVITSLIDPEIGAIRNPVIDFDGLHAIVSIHPLNTNSSNLYSLDLNDRSLTPLTTADNVSDVAPIFLPDGSIAFASNRDLRFGNDGKLLTSLYCMERDGTNIHRIGGIQSESPVDVLPDGRILYTRRNPISGTQVLNTVNIDGTAHMIFWDGGDELHGMITGACPLPTSGETLCVIQQSDGGRSILALIDRRMGKSLDTSLIRSWPEGNVNLTTGTFQVADGLNGSSYADPVPLDENFFLCSKIATGDSLPGLWLIDRFGNELLFHNDEAGCYEPVPVMPRNRPPVIPPRRQYTDENGKLYVFNVYDSSDLDDVQAGSASYLRIIESQPRHTGSTVNTDNDISNTPVIGPGTSVVRHVLGTVPIESDGSAFFTLPSELIVSFQLLDHNGLCIQSMHSGVMVQAGETTGCMGCHDNRTSSPPVAFTKMPIALTFEPSTLTDSGSTTNNGFINTVQPILTASCIQCHDYGAHAGDVLNLAPDRTTVYNTAYEELWHNGLVGLEADPTANERISPPFLSGSSSSRLLRTILSGHQGIHLSTENIDLIASWIDSGAPYYDTYLSAFPDNPAGRSPLDSVQLSRLAELTGETISNLINISADTKPLISFDRPEESSCLALFGDNDNDDMYREAVSIIREGKRVLDSTNRADMIDFTPSSGDSLDLARAAHATEIEMLNREAILLGNHRRDTQ